MNAQLKQQIDERLERLSDSRMAEVLDFVEFLTVKEQATNAEHAPALAGIDAVQNLLLQIVTLPPQGHLTGLQLDLTGYKFDREEASLAKPFFLDTNVLVYAYTSQSDARSEVANALITSGESMIGVQVLNEFCNTIWRKFPNLYPKIGPALDELVSALPMAPLTLATTRSAVHLSQRYKWSYYDPLIVAAALDAGCTVLLSEDMQRDMTVETLRIQNPFLLA